MIYIADPNPWLALYAQPLRTRIAPPTADLQSFLSTYGRSQQQTCTLSRISPEIESELTEALATLPESLLNTLNKSVLGIFFADGLGASGLTDMVALGDGSNNIGFIIVLDTHAFAHASANAWASWKENSAFTADEEVQIQVCIANEDSDHRVQALRFLLLHEFGHVLATMTDICPKEWSFPLPKLAGHFSKHSWQTSGTKAIRPEQNFPHREKISFYRQPALHASQALDIYRDLARTAFPTLYASMDVQEDFAECFATYVHTQLLGQPYSVQVKVGDALVFTSDDFWASSRAIEKRRYFHNLLQSLEHNNAGHTFQGLAPFLRMNLNGADLRSHAQSLLVQANQDQENAILWMNLATVFLCLKMRDMGLAIQEQALALQRLYIRPADCRRPKFRLLMIMTAGDLSENTPIDCLLENTPVELLYYYATVEQPLPSPLPEHDAVMVGLSDSQFNRALLLAVQASLSGHAKPVINPPHLLPNVNRDQLSALLQEIPGLEMPRTHKLSRSQVVTGLSLQNQGKQSTPEALPGFPLIIRPVGSQAGNNLARITSANELADYLKEVTSPDFFVSRFVDYSSHDGQFRKYRIAMLRGEPFICHMAISSDWMVHYVNAGMYESAEKREEEGLFMQNFNRFATRHQAALSAIYA
ncbi:MAG: hypothetical protein E6Q51_05340, partial [Methylophilus methylotrophus]